LQDTEGLKVIQSAVEPRPACIGERCFSKTSRLWGNEQWVSSACI